jgi:hypothetical protein
MNYKEQCTEASGIDFFPVKGRQKPERVAALTFAGMQG